MAATDYPPMSMRRTPIPTMARAVRVGFIERRRRNLLLSAGRMICGFRLRHHHHRLGSYCLGYCLHHCHDNCQSNHSILHWPRIGSLQLCVQHCVLRHFNLIHCLVHIRHCLLLLRHCNCLRLHLFNPLLGQYHSLCHQRYWSVQESMLEILGRHSYLLPKHCKTLLVNSRIGQESWTSVWRTL